VTQQNLAATIRSLAIRLQRETGIKVEVRGLGGAELEQSPWLPAMLHERVRRFGGHLAIESTPGAGAAVVVEWPRTGHG